jgi:uncharacterized membrane protein
LRDKRKHFVVIHDSVHGFNPHWVDITIENYPLVLLGIGELALTLAHITHHGGEDTILPFFGLGVHVTEQLFILDALGVDDVERGLVVDVSASSG